MSDTDRLDLIRQVFGVLFRETESFHHRTGGNLAYLLGGIATGTAMDFSQPGDREFLTCLRVHFPEQHHVWEFVQCDPETQPEAEIQPDRKLPGMPAGSR